MTGAAAAAGAAARAVPGRWLPGRAVCYLTRWPVPLGWPAPRKSSD
jgi:hypothetical protein